MDGTYQVLLLLRLLLCCCAAGGAASPVLARSFAAGCFALLGRSAGALLLPPLDRADLGRPARVQSESRRCRRAKVVRYKKYTKQNSATGMSRRDGDGFLG
jgi:hypothetical protein